MIISNQNPDHFDLKGSALRAEDLVLNELVEFSEGLLSLHGRRLVIHDVHAFAQFRKELVDSVGDEQARRILTRFGYYWGQADAAGMNRIFRWEDTREWLMAGPRLHTLQGVAKTTVKSLTVDETSRTFHMVVVWQDSGEAEEHLYEFERSDRPMCSMLVGTSRKGLAEALVCQTCTLPARIECLRGGGSF